MYNVAFWVMVCVVLVLAYAWMGREKPEQRSSARDEVLHGFEVREVFAKQAYRACHKDCAKCNQKSGCTWYQIHGG